MIDSLVARTPQTLRFLVLGGTAAAVTWLVRFPLSNALPFWAAVVIANLVGMTLGFFSYDRWVFPGSTSSIGLRLRNFIAVNMIGLLVTSVVAVTAAELLLLVDILAVMREGLAHAFGIAAGAFLNFIGHKRVTYR